VRRVVDELQLRGIAGVARRRYLQCEVRRAGRGIGDVGRQEDARFDLLEDETLAPGGGGARGGFMVCS